MYIKTAYADITEGEWISTGEIRSDKKRKKKNLGSGHFLILLLLQVMEKGEINYLPYLFYYFFHSIYSLIFKCSSLGV